jgi:hypothetical protein
LPHVGLEAEEEFGKRTPWDSITKLEWTHKDVVRRTTLWRLMAMTNLVRSDLVSPGGRDMLDLVRFKLDLRNEMLINQADQCGLSAEHKFRLWTVFESHETYADYLDNNTDMPWIPTMPPSVREFIAVVGVGWPTNTPVVTR